MPSVNEILLASNCQRCRAYFNKTGPVCAHCRLEELIIAYKLKLVAFKSKRKVLVSLANVSGVAANVAVRSNGKGAQVKDKSKRSRKDTETGIDTSAGRLLGSGATDGDAFHVQNFDMEMVEGAFCMIIKHLRAYAIRFASSKGLQEDEWLDLQVLRDAAVSECQRCESMRKEVLAMTGLWQRYMALLKVHDEVDQGRRRIGLVDEENGVNAMTGNNLYGYELPMRFQEDYCQAVEREILLRESIGQLAFYKNQELEARCRLAVARRHRAGLRKAAVTSVDEILLKPADKNPLSVISASPIIGKKILDVEGKDEDDLTCVFCRESLSDSIRQSGEYAITDELGRRTESAAVEPVVCLPCAHSFHKACVRRWLQLHGACPVCKRAAVLDACVPVDMSDDSRNWNRNMRKLKPLQSPIGLVKLPLMSNASESGEEITCTTVLEEVDVESDVEVKGQWGSKIDALVADLLRLLMKGEDRGQGEKVVVFSQWAEMLEIVSEALHVNGICYSLCTDRSKDFSECGPLERFKSDLDTRVLLLPLHLGAEGLDLVQASHLFLLEPLLNPALESQAVNRIHRIGQTRTTHVHKFAVKGTVEELILRGQQLKILSTLNETYAADDAFRSSIYSKKKSKITMKRDQDFLTLQNIHYLLGMSGI